jgi:predicted nucleic acid-binding protein
MITRNKVFLDTSFTIALSFITDRHHEHARVLTTKIKQTNTSLITTRAVIIEILNTLAKERYRKGAVNLINSLEADPNITIVPITEDLYNKALKLYKTRVDKEWGITDCISFVVMEEYGLTEALTADKHFQQAGFKALLLL